MDFRKLQNSSLLIIIALIWGFLEGVIFFIVPDVFILLITLFLPILGLKAWAYSILGSLLAVLTLFTLSSIYSPQILLDFMTQIPGITSVLNSHVVEKIQLSGMPYDFNLVKTGVPLKIYALSMFSLNYSLITVLIWTVFARIVRIAPGYLMHFLFHKIFHKSINRTPIFWIILYILSWIAFYTFYFSKMKLQYGA